MTDHLVMPPDMPYPKPIGDRPTRDEYVQAAADLIDLKTIEPAIEKAEQLLARSASWMFPLQRHGEPVRIYAKPVGTAYPAIMLVGEAPNQLVIVEQPANMCTFVDAARVVEVLMLVEQIVSAWRSQDGFNGALIDRLAEVIGAEPLNTSVIL